MLQKSFSQFIRKQLIYPETGLSILEKVLCNNLRHFCSETNQSSESRSSTEAGQSQAAPDTQQTEQGEQAAAQNPTTEAQGEPPQETTSAQQPPPPDQQNQQQINQEENKVETTYTETSSRGDGSGRPQRQRDDYRQRGPRASQYQRDQNFQQKDQYWRVLRVENISKFALRTDVQELCSAFGAEISIENIVPEFYQRSFGVRRWWLLVTQKQKEALFEAKLLDHFRLSERRVSIFQEQMQSFNNATFNTMGLSNSMGRYVIVHDLPLTSHEADVLRIFKNFNIAPNGVQVLQLDHLNREKEMNLSRKKALIKFMDDLEAHRAIRTMHGKQINRNYEIKLTLLP